MKNSILLSLVHEYGISIVSQQLGMREATLKKWIAGRCRHGDRGWSKNILSAVCKYGISSLSKELNVCELVCIQKAARAELATST